MEPLGVGWQGLIAEASTVAQVIPQIILVGGIDRCVSASEGALDVTWSVSKDAPWS